MNEFELDQLKYQRQRKECDTIIIRHLKVPDIRKVTGACNGRGDQLSIVVLGAASLVLVLVLVLPGRGIQSLKSLTSRPPHTHTDHHKRRPPHIHTDHQKPIQTTINTYRPQTDHTETLKLFKDSKTVTEERYRSKGNSKSEVYIGVWFQNTTIGCFSKKSGFMLFFFIFIFFMLFQTFWFGFFMLFQMLWFGFMFNGF